MEHRHTETLLLEICQRESYGSIILNICKATVLSYFAIANDRAILFPLTFQVAMSQYVDVHVIMI